MRPPPAVRIAPVRGERIGANPFLGGGNYGPGPGRWYAELSKSEYLVGAAPPIYRS